MVSITFGVIGYVVWMVNITIAAPFDIFDIGTKRNGLPERTNDLKQEI